LFFHVIGLTYPLFRPGGVGHSVPVFNYRVFSIKRQTPNKCGVYSSEFKIIVRCVYSGSRRLFEMGVLYQDYMSQPHASSLSTILFELYTDIQTTLSCTKVLLTERDENNKRRIKYRVNLMVVVT